MEYLHHRLQRCQDIAESEETPIKGVNRRLGLYMDKMRYSFLPPTRHGELIMIYSSPHLNPPPHSEDLSVAHKSRPLTSDSESERWKHLDPRHSLSNKDTRPDCGT